MEIKEKRAPFLIKYIVGFFTLLVILLIVTFINFQKRSADNSSILTATEIGFLQKGSTIKEVLSRYKDKTIYLSVNDDASTNLTPSTRSFFAKIDGKELAQLSFREAYVGLIENGKFIKEKKAKDAVSLMYKGTKVESSAYKVGSYSLLKKNQQEIKESNRGLHLFIIDQQHIIASFSFDFFSKKKPLSKGKPIDYHLLNTDIISIKIDKQAYERLSNKRESALRTKILLTGDEDLVSSQIQYKNKQHKAQIRLKGDWTDHLAGEQWSFRVKLKEGETLDGMRKFSLHHPKTRNYEGEWLFHQILKSEGILHLKYQFVQLELIIKDGIDEQVKNLGLYALEESFDKQLIERNKRREGIILKIDEAPLWQERADFSSKDLDLSELEYIQLANFDNLNVLPYSEKRIRQDSLLFKQFKRGQQLLTAYLQDELLISDVFDVSLLAKYNAICNLLGANHALIWHNHRFYYNPISARLEPIGFDANSIVKEWYFYSYKNAQKDLAYMEAYTQALLEVTKDEYIDRLLNWEGLEEKTSLLQSIYPYHKWEGREILKHNQQILKTYLAPVKSLNIFLKDMDKKHLKVNIENFGRFPVEILALENEGGKRLGKVATNTIISSNEKQLISLKLDPNFSKQFIAKKFKKTDFSIHSDIDKLRIVYQTIGTTLAQRATIIPWSKNAQLPPDIFTQTSTISQFDFLSIDEEKKLITCQQGVWRLSQPLVIPADYTLLVKAGTRIELTNSLSKIISFSPIRLEGSKEAPIEIYSSTKKGQGIMVFNNQDTSLIDHCKFTNLSNPTTNNWVVTGAVNFYKAPVKITNSTFSDNRSEDALNIINTYFEMENVFFSNTASDAFDGDFVEGSITNCIFNNSGNDAIDVSGSTIKVQQVAITNSGDKGISAGEASTIAAQQVVIKECEIGVASKDQSSIQLNDCWLKNNKLAFTAFQKKSEFGVASISGDAIKMNDNQLDHLIEKGSTFHLNGQLMPVVNKVKERMYGVEFGTSSQ